MSQPGGFAVSVASTTDVTFEQVPLSEGVQAWAGGQRELTGVPSHLLGGILLRTGEGALQPGALISVAPVGSDARVYVVAEASGPGNVPGRSGGLLQALAKTSRWLADSGGVPSCGGADVTLAAFSTWAQQDLPVQLPEITEADGVILLVVVPVVTGSFAVAVTSSSSASYDRMAVVEEGVVAWRDRDHRYVSVPPCLLGGVLFQGPYKDVPEGTVLTVRPNARAKVYVVVERSGGGGLNQSLPAQGWTQASGAPRWHEMPTMVTFSRDCAAGAALSLPPTKGPHTVFSVVVVPLAGVPVAPVEASCCGPAGVPRLQQLELAPLAEGAAAWDRDGHRLTKVPEWMLGATYLRTGAAWGESGPPVGTCFSVRAAHPSVVYAVVELERDGAPGHSGGLLPDILPAAGWERRTEAPEWRDGSQLAVFAKRAAGREPLSLPPLADANAALTLVVKVDVEAFDATAETSGGLELQRAEMQETVVPWSDRHFRFTWVPTFTAGGVLFRGPHCSTPSGTSIRVRASSAFRAYVIVEAEYKGGTARDGGYLKALPAAGWRTETAAPSWNDSASTMKVLSFRPPEGAEVVLPPTVGDVVFSIVVVNIAASPEKLVEEFKQVFRAWDADGKGGIRKEDLDQLLGVLCPGLDVAGRATLLAEADPRGTGKIAYEEFISRVLFGGSGV